MDGVTNLPYRTIVERIFDRHNTKNNQTLRTWTEFMNADGYMVQPHRLAHHFIHHDAEQHLIVQIYGGTRETLVAAAIDLDRKYGDRIAGIELNIGCPSPRVMACGGGSALMRDYDYLHSVVQEISESIQTPFSIKVRSWLRNDDKDEWFDVLVGLAEFCKIISIHGRTFSMGHSGENDRDYIRRFKATVGDQCLVIGNGGIKHHSAIGTTAYQNSSLPVLDGVMIGQAAIGDPWIFTEYEPTPQDRYEVIMEHMHLLLAYEYRKEQHILDLYEDDATRHNKTLLHARKKWGDIGDDTRYNIHSIVPHSYTQRLPTIDELDTLAKHIPDLIDGWAPHQGLAEFRKYLFNYIAWLHGSKELKKILARTKEYDTMKREIDGFFSRL